MQSANGEFSFNLESGHIEASDINITGGDINLDGGQLSIKNSGFKTDLSSGYLQMYYTTNMQTGANYEYFDINNTMIGTKFYATLAALKPAAALGVTSSGFRFGEKAENATLASHWDTDYMLVEKDATYIRRCVETNECLENQFAGLLHHQKVGTVEYIAGFGVGVVDGNPSAAMELSSVTGARVARLDVYSAATDRVSLRLVGQGGYTTFLTVNNGVLYVGGKKIAFA